MTNNENYILFLEDELNLAEIVRENLTARGFSISHVATIQEANDKIAFGKPALIIADVMLPDGDGFDFIKRLRRTDSQTPVIFLTARSQPKDVVKGFETGGNDYLKKPFSIAELEVRIKALLQRISSSVPSPIEFNFGKYQFKYPLGTLIHGAYEIQLTSREADLLHLLARNRNSFVSREEILINFWGESDYFSGRSLDVFISKLRKYLKNDPSIAINNVRGFGYKFVY
ncbi:DNA-binding response regulator [Robertkochia solimangrovi]|nr:DNA-binding response regulator [Robertkochia solimangrovi]